MLERPHEWRLRAAAVAAAAVPALRVFPGAPPPLSWWVFRRAECEAFYWWQLRRKMGLCSPFYNPWSETETQAAYARLPAVLADPIVAEYAEDVLTYATTTSAETTRQLDAKYDRFEQCWHRGIAWDSMLLPGARLWLAPNLARASDAVNNLAVDDMFAL